MSKPVEMKYMETDPGHCRVNFKTKNHHNQWIYYCIMEEIIDVSVKLYRSTGGDWNEPEYPVTVREGAVLNFEMPPDEYGQKLVKLYQGGDNAA